MTHGTQSEALDLQSVQRGDAQMENRVNRVIQACVELLDRNPIKSIHDQGAGGPANVLTELMEQLGGEIDIRKIVVGDPTMSDAEISNIRRRNPSNIFLMVTRSSVDCREARSPMSIWRSTPYAVSGMLLTIPRIIESASSMTNLPCF